jgi:hypothetical protein
LGVLPIGVSAHFAYCRPTASISAAALNAVRYMLLLGGETQGIASFRIIS